MAEHDPHHDEKPKKHGGHGHGHGPAGHGGGHDEEHGAPEWLISFADNTALIMGFFVIMLAMNMKADGGGNGNSKDPDAGHGPSAAMLDTVIGLRAAFNNPIDPNSNDPNELPFVARLLTRGRDSEPQEAGPRGRDHDVQSLRPSKYYRICGSLPFESGTSKLEREADETLRDLAERVRGLRFIIEVRGHVSAAEAAHAADRGMSLAFDRAMAVAKRLESGGVRWSQMRLIACADNDRRNPVAYNDSGQRPNERVEVVVTDVVLPDYVQDNDAAARRGK